MSITKSFPPIVNENSTVLILGTAPGTKSLEHQQYYASPRNQFWKLIFASFHETEIPDSYEQKINFLLKNGIALWDVIAHCERMGSLDSNIKDEIPNDFQSFFAAYPNIKGLAFNGSKSLEVFNKKVSYQGNFSILKLPSSSFARTMPFEAKLNEWKQIKKYTLSK